MSVSRRTAGEIISRITGFLSVLLVTCLALPSTRVVYYLHTKSATWNEARSMCESYGATLISYANFNATKNVVHYVDLNFWESDLQTVVGKSGIWTGLYRNSTGKLRWLGCEQDTNSPSSMGPCIKADLNFVFDTAACSSKLPYICQRDDGQCWFQPYRDNSISDNDGDAYTNDTTATTDAECAKMCRSAYDGVPNSECWAFSYHKNETCLLHFTSYNHKYALNRRSSYFQNGNFTAYVKICTGGWKSTLSPVVSDSGNPQDENCTAFYQEAWDDTICYCECDQPPVILEAESLVRSVDEKVDQIQKELYVDPHNTSSTRRKKISVEDERPSAQGIGYVGVAFLVVVLGGIALLDLNVLISGIHRLYMAFRDRKQSDC